MRKVNIALSGIGGYGNHILNLLLDYVPDDQYNLVGVADPFAENAPRYAQLKEMGVPIYKELPALLDAQPAEALYIASPIRFHPEQCAMALGKGIAVLCEKPITARIEDALAIRDAAVSAGRPVGVGYQWSYGPAFLSAKRDMIDGMFGAPVMFKSLVSWPRYDAYYADAGWKGKLGNAKDGWILDSVATNATAHYLHNLFFMMGDAAGRSAMPVQTHGAAYRARAIESFDTCALKGRFANGAEYLFLTTHSGLEKIEPMMSYQFEKATLTLNMDGADPRLIAVFADGSRIDYGSVGGPWHESRRLLWLLDAVRTGAPSPCPVEAALPHLAVTNALFDHCTIRDFENPTRLSDPAGWAVLGLSGDLLACFEKGLTPHEAGCAWAARETELPVQTYYK